jgi:hypothetical protein
VREEINETIGIFLRDLSLHLGNDESNLLSIERLGDDARPDLGALWEERNGGGKGGKKEYGRKRKKRE